MKLAGAKSDSRTIPARDALHPAAKFPIIGIGSSAGGLDACRKLLDSLPADSGMAFILIQHLDPTHESMMVELLRPHTPMTVRQATEGMPVEPNFVYVIPPGSYLSVGNGALHLTQPKIHHGARLPFDFLLNSMAGEYGARAICVILSGTGADGCVGLKAVKAKGGRVIAQDPTEAGYDGMPRSAIATGAVDLVLEVAKMPAALHKYDAHHSDNRQPGDPTPEIVELLRTRTAHDFTLYKPGTLQRRIAQRAAMIDVDTGRYLELLRTEENELQLLAKDLLINVTSFFRDPGVFDFLTEKIIPEIIRERPADQPLRIWTAGCSTGEEAYSFAIVFQEAIEAAKREIKLQIFASDVDPDAVERAREGFYPSTIEANVSRSRLGRFFVKEDSGYRISPALRSSVVFTVQDILADPPFSRLDFVSCRNLLIYLGDDAQARVAAIFHFALSEGGVLLLGGSETIVNATDRFTVISKTERLYRRIGRNRPGELGLLRGAPTRAGVAARSAQGHAPSRHAALAELCRRLVIETFAPAAALINRNNECLYLMGSTDRYLQLAPGRPVLDLLVMAREGVRTRLRSAIQLARQENKRIVIAGRDLHRGVGMISFDISVQPVQSDGEELLLICFIDRPDRKSKHESIAGVADIPRVTELEQELEATKTELLGAIHNLEISSEEQKTINEEALSVNEEYQSTNEELLASKEELQSLNEELIALNNQLQETLQRQRTTSNDLQNVLYSTNVATIFLDTNLGIRFFTPSTRSLFNIIPGDVGRPLADLSPLAADGVLLADAQAVLKNFIPIEREIEVQNGAWYIRRILPYRTQGTGVEGVVITFVDITERKHASVSLEIAKQQSQSANIAKSRFLAAASHDLRQPLQTLTLLQDQLARTVEGTKAQSLVSKLGPTLDAMSSMLNKLLDINQIEAGTIRAELAYFQTGEMFDRLSDEFALHAEARHLELRIVKSGLIVRSDPRLLEQMIRNLLSNALKYTEGGKVLLGCRRSKGALRIEVWDTGVGIPDRELNTIFEEYHQLDNAAPERTHGLGLGLSIVRRLGDLLGHSVSVRSRLGKGSVFVIEVALMAGEEMLPENSPRAKPKIADDTRRTGAILVVEDDVQLRELLAIFLQAEGHYLVTAADGPSALALIANGAVRPDLILADYSLPNGMDGLEASLRVRTELGRQIPVIILTGDISTEVLRSVARQHVVQLNKPAKLSELSRVVQRLLPMSQAAGTAPSSKTAEGAEQHVICVIDDDNYIRDELRTTLEGAGRTVQTYPTSEAFLEAYDPVRHAILLIDAGLPGMSGIDLLHHLKSNGHSPLSIVITGSSDVHMAVEAMKAGALDFIEKPVGRDELLTGVSRALEQLAGSSRLSAWRESAARQIATLTYRQREIMELVLAGHPSKNIAADLGISQRTIENHRASIMRKTGAKSLPALARLALAASGIGADDPTVQTRFPDATTWPTTRR